MELSTYFQAELAAAGRALITSVAARKVLWARVGRSAAWRRGSLDAAGSRALRCAGRGIWRVAAPGNFGGCLPAGTVASSRAGVELAAGASGWG